ncbi:GTPase IMAP family member 8 [Haplochromis burtoni]|uniref:GTPase IMAP family member 8 n=1 Tax=Haplochromis burtoni TaxID=8153 RepID=UPI0003BDAB40|nr:GTPase IMAP family member 8 [Haplochromis burtoni]
MDPDPGPDLTVVLLGNCGVGKSASGNTILGRAAFESKTSFKAGESEIREEAGRVFGKVIRVIDTPGILGREEPVGRCCRHVLESPGSHLFLLVVKTDRFTAEQERGVEAGLAAVGGRGFSRCYLLFTGGDALKNTSLHDFIYQDRQSPLPGVVARFSGRVHLFNNEDAGREQVRELLLKAGLLHCPPAECVGSEVRRILLIGPPGGGKSSAGNSVLGRRHFEVDCDFHGGGRGHVCGEAEGGRVFVVDSAGLSGEGLTREQLLRDIESAARLADPGPHVVAVVVKIGQLSATDSRALTLLTELLEGVASRHAAVLFTHGDALGDRPLQDAIRSSRRVSDLVSRCRGRHCVLDNTRSGERAQVERFLRLVDDIIRENDGRHWSRDALRSGDLEDTSCSNNVVEHALAARTPPSLLSVCWRLLCLSALFVRRHFHWI